ncbi:hypothetical protein PM082_022354 [Marasmius tenuissimus]|nr:hypothetical protein PM082_022354 [Marasmius tenuissimus]
MMIAPRFRVTAYSLCLFPTESESEDPQKRHPGHGSHPACFSQVLGSTRTVLLTHVARIHELDERTFISRSSFTLAPTSPSLAASTNEKLVNHCATPPHYTSSCSPLIRSGPLSTQLHPRQHYSHWLFILTFRPGHYDWFTSFTTLFRT